jgi:multidrug efflux pump subunit AcrA (membrane-fusion protein)
VSADVLIPLLTFGGTLLLVVTGLLNFSVFVRQLRAAQEQLETARRQLESARQQPEIQLVQRLISETSDHLRILIERPYLRPYFYENRTWAEGDTASLDEVKAMAELLLNNFASAIINSATFPQYPVRGVEQTIRFHLKNSPALRDCLLESFDRFQLAGLALLCLKNETKAETEEDLRRLLATSAGDARERARRERLLRHLQSTDKAEPLELAKYSLERASKLSLETGYEDQGRREVVA